VDRVGEGRDIGGLAEELQAHPAALRRMLRALAAADVFSVNHDDFVTPTPASRYLSRDTPGSLHAAAAFWGMPDAWAAWGDLAHSIRTGRSAFEHRLQMPLFDYLDSRPEEATHFHRFMSSGIESRHEAVLAACDFQRFGSLVDVGGGNGMLLARILSTHAGASGTLFDRAGALDNVVPEIRRLCAAGRCSVVAGDFFHSVPKGADAYLLSQIVHDWGDDDAVHLLRNCRRAAGTGAVALLIERVLQGRGSRSINNFLSDIEMLVLHQSAERTPAEYEALAREAGWRVERIIETSSPFSVIECTAV
jgi:hypothetical protein